ncbi:MAG: flagellar export chaperone FliS [Firmicutes bacterium]|nr:flagellar export chaperone FliS [Bacillota bacterium]
MYAHAYQQYRQTQVETAGPGQLILMLYNGGIRFCKQAQGALEKGQLEVAHRALVRAQQIVDELMAALDLEAGEVAHNLMRLYEYMNQRLLEANLKKDQETLGEVKAMFTELRDAWQAMLKSGQAASPRRVVL